MTYSICKRSFDFSFSILLLVLLSPLIVVICILVFLFIGSPVLFVQVRPGLRGRPFRIFKFRTMLNLRELNGGLLPDSQRLTSFGRFLRSTSLDELPSLLNILIGDMSFVGPRPLLMEYLSLYSDEQARRHDVKPGLTGLAQINGRNCISWDEKFRLDVWYVDHQSFLMDVRILLFTIWKVVCREGISANGEATTAPFTGNI